MRKQWEDGLGHPCTDLIYLAGGMAVTILTMHPVLLACSAGCAACYAWALWHGKLWKRLLILMIPVVLFTVFLVPLFSHRGVTPLFYINGMAVTLESFRYGAVMSLMLLAMFLWFQIAEQLLDSEKLFYLLGRFFPSVGLLVSMIFRMLPLMGERFLQIRDAQRGMGRRAEELSLPGRGRLLLKEISILVSWSLESSVGISISMETRGYGTGRRSHFSLFILRKRDTVRMLLLVLLYGISLVMAAAGKYQASYYPEYSRAGLTAGGAIGIFSFVLAALFPLLPGKGFFKNNL